MAMSLQASPCHSPPVCIGKHLENQLGRLIHLDAATTKGVVDRLEGRGFVTVRPDARDRRRGAIALTERGRAAAAATVKVAREVTRHTLVPLTAAEQRAVIRPLRKLT
jgi:DNA-binding MarR family transcriptional regulator